MVVRQIQVIINKYSFFFFPLKYFSLEAKSKEKSDQLRAILCCLYMFFVAYLTFTNYET
jgi:hypothetical protein